MLINKISVMRNSGHEDGSIFAKTCTDFMPKAMPTMQPHPKRSAHTNSKIIVNRDSSVHDIA